MEMQINCKLLKHERSKRAWSQEHLAQVTGLGLRTIQRIEASGLASNESISAISTAFEMTVAEFLENLPLKSQNNLTIFFQENRHWAILLLTFIALLVSPPQITAALACMGGWVVFEFSMFFCNKRFNVNNA